MLKSHVEEGLTSWCQHHMARNSMKKMGQVQKKKHEEFIKFRKESSSKKEIKQGEKKIHQKEIRF